MDKEFTHEYWQSQMMEFRELMGDKTAMSDPERMQRHINALGYVYFHSEGITDSDITLMQATMWEFTRRQELWHRYCEGKENGT